MKEELPVYVAKPESDEAPLLDSHDFFMLILLMAIAFRSLWWNVVHMMCFNNDAWLLGIGCSAGAGKLLGGYISDKVDWKKFIFISMSGAVLSLFIFEQTLNVFSYVGIIVLVGIVTKNGILIVEFANQKKETGLNKFDAVLEAATQRFRPILMTSFATILGALPIALALGASSKSRVSMGIAIIGGLLFSLILTLYLIPLLYLMWSSKRKKIAHTNED